MHKSASIYSLSDGINTTFTAVLKRTLLVEDELALESSSLSSVCQIPRKDSDTVSVTWISDYMKCTTENCTTRVHTAWLGRHLFFEFVVVTSLMMTLLSSMYIIYSTTILFFTCQLILRISRVQKSVDDDDDDDESVHLKRQLNYALRST